MKPYFASKVLLPVCLCFAVSAAAFAHEPKDSAHAAMPMAKDAAMNTNMDASMQMHQVMMPAKAMEMPMSGNVDKDFAAMMSMHHQMAIDMVDIYLKNGHNAKLKSMAMKMKTAQQAEIKQMATFK